MFFVSILNMPKSAIIQRGVPAIYAFLSSFFWLTLAIAPYINNIGIKPSVLCPWYNLING